MPRLEARIGLTIPAALLALGTAAPVGGEELWRRAVEGAECRIELYNELGDVRLVAGSAEDPVVTVRGGPGLAIEPSAPTGPTRLTVTRAASELEPAPADVDLAVPPGCEVAVRTSAGGVTLDIAREASPTTVETLTGDITARIDPDTDATVVFATSGEITTDFGVEIRFRYHEEPAKHGWVAFGDQPPIDSGPKKIRLTTRRGAVRLLRPSNTETAHPVETPHGRPEPR